MNSRLIACIVLLLVLAGAAWAADVAKPDSVVSLELRDADARTALEVLFRSGGKQFALDAGVSGSVGSVSFKDTPFDTALRQLTRSAGLTYRITDDVYIVTAKPKPVESPVGGPAVNMPQELPVVADEIVCEKIKLIHMSAAEILQALQGQISSGIASWQSGPAGVQQISGRPTGPVPSYSPVQQYRPTMGVPTAGSFQAGSRTW